MTLPVVFRELAAEDVQGVVSWYEERQSGLGARFVSSLDIAVGLIAEHPRSCPIAYRGLRRVLLPGFPYALFYQLEPAAVVVLACLHQSRGPRVTRKRLRAGA